MTSLAGFDREEESSPPLVVPAGGYGSFDPAGASQPVGSVSSSHVVEVHTAHQEEEEEAAEGGGTAVV